MAKEAPKRHLRRGWGVWRILEMAGSLDKRYLFWKVFLK